jgi:hypothetical protein
MPTVALYTGKTFLEFPAAHIHAKKVTVTSTKNSIHAVFSRRSLLRKLHQKPSVFAW